VVQKKNAQSLMHRHFAAVCSRITRISPNCSEQKQSLPSVQNMHKLVTYSLIKSPNWIHVMSDAILHVNMTPLTVDDRLLIKTSQTEKGWIVEKQLSFQQDSSL